LLQLEAYLQPAPAADKGEAAAGEQKQQQGTKRPLAGASSSQPAK
jgi:hypothetical protein